MDKTYTAKFQFLNGLKDLSYGKVTSNLLPRRDAEKFVEEINQQVNPYHLTTVLNSTDPELYSTMEGILIRNGSTYYIGISVPFSSYDSNMALFSLQSYFLLTDRGKIFYMFA